mgnify:CR=1 FL=1
MKNEIKALFIGGAGHSGTTMLSNIFASHQASLKVHGESRVSDSYHLLIKTYKNLSDNEKRLKYLEKHTFYGVTFKKQSYQYGKKIANPYIDILEANELSGDFDKDYHTLIREALKKKSLKFFIEKTPSNVFHADEIFQLIPEAKLLIIHRDVRDVVASLKKRYINLLENPDIYKHNLTTKKLDKDYNLMMDALMWQKAVQASQRALAKFGSDNVRILRYESFVSSPQESTQEICEWLGVDFQDQMLDLKARNSADQSLKKQKGISRSSIGNYNRVLNNEEIAVIEKYAAKGMHHLGIKRHVTGHKINSFKKIKYELQSYGKIIDRIRKRLTLMQPEYAWSFSKRVFKKLIS